MLTTADRSLDTRWTEILPTPEPKGCPQRARRAEWYEAMAAWLVPSRDSATHIRLQAYAVEDRMTAVELDMAEGAFYCGRESTDDLRFVSFGVSL